MREKVSDDVFFKTIEIGAHQVPGIWKYMLPEDFLWLNLPEERCAVCDDCHKVKTENYRVDCQCCTYFPQMPNYMVGLSLLDPASKELMTRLVDDGGALPEGSQVSPGRFRTITEIYSKDLFGKSREITCPLINVDTGKCGVYAYRNSVCATFFCENDHGMEGFEYWRKVQVLAGQIETALCQWAMEKVGFSCKAYIERLNTLASSISEVTDPKTKNWSADTLKFLWSDWYGREVEFFIECAKCAMEAKEELSDIACDQELLEAFKYENAIKQWIPKKYHDEIPFLPKEPGEPTMISQCWYELQLATRQLWELPFNEGTVVLNEKATITDNPKDNYIAQKFASHPFVVILLGETEADSPKSVFLEKSDRDVLGLFAVEQILGERIFETKEVEDHANPRRFLAECLRRGILVSKT